MSIAGAILPDPPENTDNSYTYQTVWTSTNVLLKGSYTYKVTNGADMTIEGTLEVTGTLHYIFSDLKHKQRSLTLANYCQ